MQENNPLESNNNDDEQAQRDSEQNDQQPVNPEQEQHTQNTAQEQAQQTQNTAQEQPAASSTNANLPDWLQAEIKSGSTESETSSTSTPSFSGQSGSTESEIQQLRDQVTSYQHQLGSTQRQLNSLRASVSYAPPQERGGCLTTWLVIIGIVNVFSIVGAFVTFGTDAMSGLLLLVGGCAALAGVVGTWQFKRWGYYTLMTLYVIAGIFGLFNLCSAANTGFGIGSIIGALIGMGLLYLLVRDKWEAFE